MKILDTKTFEKLKIDSIDISRLNTIDTFSVNTIKFIKENLKTFDIVKIKELLFMYISYEDFSKYKGNIIDLNILEKHEIIDGVFARYKNGNAFNYSIYCVKNYTSNLIHKYLDIPVTNVWIASDNTVKYLKNYFKDDNLFDFLNQEFLNELLKTQNYKHFENKLQINAKNI